MNIKLLNWGIVLCAGMLFVQSCAPSISLDARWKNPDTPSGINPAKTLVIVVGKSMQTRKQAEDAFELALSEQGYPAVGAFETLPVSADQLDSTQLRQLIKDLGCDAVISARAVDVSTSQHWVPGTTYPPPYYRSYYGYGGYYGYYGASSPGYMDETTTALLETNLYDTKSGTLVWLGQSSIIVSGSQEKLVAKYAAVVVNGMIADGALTK